MAFAYSDMDKLIIERWSDVVGLLEAHRRTQDRIEEMNEAVGKRIARWAQSLGYETEVSAKEAEFRAWKPNWAEKRRVPKVKLAVGASARLVSARPDAPHSYLWVYTDGLAEYKIKDPDRVAFAHGLRIALGDQARTWEADGVDDADRPLGRYLPTIGNEDRAKLLQAPDALFAFVSDSFSPLFEVAEIIDAELQRLGR